MLTRSRLAIAATALLALALVGPIATAGATPPIWEPNFGATIPVVTDGDDVAAEVPIGTFSFPFYGATHTGAEKFGVSSNGLITFNAKNEDNTPSAEDARTGAPKIAALWADFNPSPGVPPDQGSVYMNSFNDDGDPAIDRVVFTWDSAFFGCENRPSCRGLVQVQLLDTGRIIFGYNGVLTNQGLDNYGGSGLMPVVAKGGFTKPTGPTSPQFLPTPPGIDYSEMVPFDGGELIYELFSGEPVHFDLDQTNLVFDPTAGGFHVTSPVDIGVTATGKPAKVAAGKTVTYTASVKNNGTLAAAGVTLVDTLPTGAKLVSGKKCKGKTSVTCSLGTIAPGATVTVKLKAKMGELPANAVNRIDVSTTTVGDMRGNNTAEVTTKVTKAKAKKHHKGKSGGKKGKGKGK
jgi:uncharacterized repeat protein (TIGR01451 family)